MRKRKYIVMIVFVALFAVLGYGVFAYRDVIFSGSKFKDGTTINGIDVSGMDKLQAQNVVATKITDDINNIKITLTYKGKSWVFNGSDFEISNVIAPYIENVFEYYNSGNMLERKYKINKLNGNNNFSVSYTQVLAGLDEKINALATEIDRPAIDATVVFDANQKNPVSYSSEESGLVVDKEKLKQQIDQNLAQSTTITLEVPTKEVFPSVKLEDIQNSVTMRGSFSTSYKTSNADRKFNVKHALNSFNGMVILPGEEISFNKTTGPRTAENGYKKANVILNGVYVEGYGGGVCQASTTLYNALLNADLEILEVNKHTLPSSYVWLAFDAMVSEGYADLKFKNSTQNNIYIKTYANEENVYVEVYGMPFGSNETVKRRVEFVGAIPHPGDRIVKDSTGQYSNKVTFKGEYLRLKYPQEGYRAKAYIDRYIDGVLVDSKLIRDETYEPQEGIIIEGTEDLMEGMTLPENNVKFIPPQSSSVVNKNNVQNKIEKENPSNYNP